MSPSWMTRSPISWCGLAPFGPGADDGEVDLRVAVLAQEAGEVGGDLASRCGPRTARSTISSRLASAAAPAAASRSSSSASLIARSIGSASVIET